MKKKPYCTIELSQKQSDDLADLLYMIETSDLFHKWTTKIAEVTRLKIDKNFEGNL